MKIKYIHITLLLSLILHSLFVLLKLRDGEREASVLKKSQKIKIVLRRNEKKKDKKKKQIVENTFNKKNKVPKKSKFLSKSDQYYDRQTVSKITDSFNEAGMGSRAGQDQNAAEEEREKNPKRKQQLKKHNKIIAKKFKKMSLKDLSLGKQLAAESFSKSFNKVRKGLKTGNKKNRGLAKSNDFVENLPLGDMTKLNTIEYKYYGFYYRIKLKLEQYWGNSLREKANDLQRAGRKIASDSQKITALKITLDSFGNIVDVFLKSTSGVRELDDAAIESFTKAGPFPNPPKGMLKNGKAVIEWGFVVKS